MSHPIYFVMSSHLCQERLLSDIVFLEFTSIVLDVIKRESSNVIHLELVNLKQDFLNVEHQILTKRIQSYWYRCDF